MRTTLSRAEYDQRVSAWMHRHFTPSGAAALLAGQYPKGSAESRLEMQYRGVHPAADLPDEMDPDEIDAVVEHAETAGLITTETSVARGMGITLTQMREIMHSDPMGYGSIYAGTPDMIIDDPAAGPVIIEEPRS